MPLALVAATAVPPPNWLKLTVTVAIVTGLLSPLVELFHVAVTVSPILKAPPVPVPPLMLIRGAVTVGVGLAAKLRLSMASASPAPVVPFSLSQEMTRDCPGAQLMPVTVPLTATWLAGRVPSSAMPLVPGLGELKPRLATVVPPERLVLPIW